MQQKAKPESAADAPVIVTQIVDGSDRGIRAW